MLTAAHNDTVLHVDWPTGDDVTVFTLSEAQFVDVDDASERCVYVNSSRPVMMAVSDAAATRLVTAETSSSYTLIAHRRQYDSDRQLRHYVNVLAHRASINSLVIDDRRLNQTTLNWTLDVCDSRRQLVSATIPVDAGAHRLYAVDGRAVIGSVLGYSDTASYMTSLASVNDVDDHVWTARRHQTSASLTSSTSGRDASTDSVTLSDGVTSPASEQPSTLSEQFTRSTPARDDRAADRWLP